MAAGLYLVYRLLFILELVAIAMLLALVLRSLVGWLRKYGVRPWMSAILLLGMFSFAGAFVWFVLAPNIMMEVRQIFTGAPGILDQLAAQSRQKQSVSSALPDLTSLTDQLKGYLSRLEERLPQLTTQVFQIFLDIVATMFLALYMAIDPGAPVQGLLRLAPHRKREGLRSFLRELEQRLRGWMIGAGVAMLFVGSTATFGLWILGVPLPLTFGIIAGLLNIVPFLGSIVGALLPALVALAISPVKALLVLALFLVINQIEGNIIQPLVMGREAELHPVLVLLSFLIVGAILGPAGLLLAVPAVILLVVVLNRTVPDEPLEEGEQPAEGEDESSK